MAAEGQQDIAARGGLELLVQAVAGRRVGLAVTGGEWPTTDGAVLAAPAAPVQELRVPVAAQAGLIAIGSLEPAIMARLVGRRSATARYLALEVRRLLATTPPHLPPAVERALLAGTAGLPLKGSASASLEAAGRGEGAPLAPGLVGVLRPSAVLRARASSAAELHRKADRTRLDRLRDLTDEALEEGDDEDEQDSASARSRLTAPFANSPLARLMRSLMDGTVGRSSDADGGSELPVGGARAVRDIGAGGRVNPFSGVARPPDGPHADGAVYPEWDDAEQAFKPRHCVVSHMDPAAAAGAELPLRRDHPLQAAVMRLGMAQRRHRRQPDGESLDLQALVDFGVARAAGADADARVYESRRLTARDLGVTLLLDASGSTGGLKDDGGRIWDAQRQLAGTLIDALEQVGDRVAAYGFRSYGRTDVRFLRIKHFDDRFDRAAERRLSGLQPAGYTRLGAALRHGTALTHELSGTSRKLLMLVSDGLPYEDDYLGAYAAADARHALAEAEASGVACVCVSLGTTQDPGALARIWGAFQHLHIDEPRQLAPNVDRLVRGALKAALGASHGLAASDHHRTTQQGTH